MFKFVKAAFVAAMLLSTPAVAQFDSAPPPTNENVQKHYTQSLEHNWVGNLFFDENNSHQLVACNVNKTWTAHPRIKRSTGAEEVNLMLLLGTLSDGDRALVFKVSSPQWTTTDGKEYKIHFKWKDGPNAAVHELDAVGFGAGALASSVSEKFMEFFASSHEIVLWINEKEVGKYTLEGSRNAVNMIVACQGQLDQRDTF